MLISIASQLFFQLLLPLYYELYQYVNHRVAHITRERGENIHKKVENGSLLLN